jgi:hypothetical protein
VPRPRLRPRLRGKEKKDQIEKEEVRVGGSKNQDWARRIKEATKFDSCLEDARVSFPATRYDWLDDGVRDRAALTRKEEQGGEVNQPGRKGSEEALWE